MAMDNLSEHIDFNSILETAVVPEADHGLTMLLLDSDEIPTDVRWRLTTKYDYTSDYESSGVPYKFAQDYWSQVLAAQNLMFGRWVKADTYGYFVEAGTPNVDPTDYAALTASEGFNLAVEGINAGAPELIDGITWSGVTTFQDALDAINAVIATVDSGNYAAYELKLDKTGRLICVDETDTGSTSAQVTITSHGTPANDIADSDFLNLTGGTWVAGIDAETPTEAITAIKATKDDWYCLCERGCDADEQYEVSAVINADKKICVLWESTYTDCNDSTSLTQAFARINTANHGRTFMIYDPGTLVVNPDAVIAGAHMPAEEGTIDWANQELRNASSSNLGSTKKAILKAQNIQWFETEPRSGITTNPYGLTGSGQEMRWIIGKDWFDDKCRSDIFSAKIAAQSFGFNVQSFGTIEGIIRDTGGQAITRGFCVDTAARPFTITMPDPDDYDAAARAAHAATMTRIFKIYLDSAMYDLAITGTMSL